MTGPDPWTTLADPVDVLEVGPFAHDEPPPDPGPRRPTLPYIRMSDITAKPEQRLTSPHALPVFRGRLTAIVGTGESGKSLLAAHTVLDLAQAGHDVLVIDGEMSSSTWRQRFDALGATPQALTRICYSEMNATAADTELLLNTVDATNAQMITWDSSLALLAQTARSENDNAEVARVLSRLRLVLRRSGVAGLMVDHTASGATGPPRSRGATAKFNELDLSLGVAVDEGSMPDPMEQWSVRVTVEKDRHGLLPGRNDYGVTFVPIVGGLMVRFADLLYATNRHTQAGADPIPQLVAKIAALDPPPSRANDAAKRLGGNRQNVLAAFKVWQAQ